MAASTGSDCPPVQAFDRRCAGARGGERLVGRLRGRRLRHLPVRGPRPDLPVRRLHHEDLDDHEHPGGPRDMRQEGALHGLHPGALHGPREGALHRDRVRAHHGLQARQDVRAGRGVRQALPQGAGGLRALPGSVRSGLPATVPDAVLHSALRFSLSPLLTMAEIDEAARRIVAVVTRLRQRRGE